MPQVHRIRLTRYVASAMALAMAATLGLPVVAQAQYDTKSYDGYCYARKDKAQTNGAVIGAVVGGAAGGTVSDTRHKGVGTVAGAVIGGLVGSQVGKSSVKCYDGNYYTYRDGRYYQPPPAPEGYETLYFRDRPGSGYYSNVYDAPAATQGYGDTSYGSYNDSSDYQSRPYDNGNTQPYRPNDNQRSYTDGTPYYGSASRPASATEGWRDDQGQWHNGRPRALGWQDDQGRWHVGQVVAYGWRDANGSWHEQSSSYQSNSYGQ